jgi:hypothetical protein
MLLREIINKWSSDESTVRSILRHLIYFTVSTILGTSYAALIGLFTFPLRVSLIAWPVWVMLFWIVFAKFKLIRISGFLAVLPLSILTFEITRTITQPPVYAFQHLANDRSHLVPHARVSNPDSAPTDRGHAESKLKEVYITEDGFRADPATGRGNPPRCRQVLVGDSMIYGSGLEYSDTLGPVLQRMGIDACVFGVPGNTPVDYLATLNYVKNRIEKGAHIAIYVYVYNDFVSLRKYLERGTLGLSSSFTKLTSLINYYDQWRRTTFVQGVARSVTIGRQHPLEPWRLKIGDTKEIEVYWSHNPYRYKPAPPLDQGQRKAFQFFLRRLRQEAAHGSWRVSIVFIPDNDEMLANLAQRSPTYKDMDERRIEGLQICAALWSNCEDFTPFLYKRILTEEQNPYLFGDRHFSLFGNRVLAEHYLSLMKPAVPATSIPQSVQRGGGRTEGLSDGSNPNGDARI